MRYINQQGSHLPMYKGRYKVSDYCQLVDKSKYSNTNTVNGITFTKNKDDGTITVNGTATNRAVDTYVVYTKTRLSGKVLLTGCPNGGSSNTYYNYVYTRNSNDVWITGNNDYGNGCFLNYGVTAYSILCQIIIEKDTVCNNLVFKPQLFDLTEMYGAGNEPTTVEEFKQKFPNDLYPYSPYCWAKIKSLIYKDDINYIKMK